MPDNERSISRNVALLKVLVHDEINLLYYKHRKIKRKYFYVYLISFAAGLNTSVCPPSSASNRFLWSDLNRPFSQNCLVWLSYLFSLTLIASNCCSTTESISFSFTWYNLLFYKLSSYKFIFQFISPPAVKSPHIFTNHFRFLKNSFPPL